MDIQNYTPEFSTTWIENLALEELNMEESSVVSLNDHLNPSILLEESSINLVDQLRERFELYISKFNEYRCGKDSGASIRTFKISGTVNDFMLFRSSLRLIVARKANDLISIGFLTSDGNMFGARNTDATNTSIPHEIKAHIGAFNKISWKVYGEDVDIDAVCTYYLSEFITKSSR